MTDWFSCPQPRPDAAARLICFPHAGGSAGMFRAWPQHLPEFEVHAVRYPGRAERLAEPPPDDLGRLAAQIAAAIGPDGRRLLLFGHSLGAVVALETARCLHQAGVAVTHLYASGSRAAPLPAPGDPAPADDDPATITRLISLGGTDPELAADPLFQELVLPYVRSDGEMFHRHAAVFAMKPALDCPVTAIAGDADVDADERPWPELTRGGFRERAVAGDHFYLTDDPPFELLRRDLAVGAA